MTLKLWRYFIVEGQLHLVIIGHKLMINICEDAYVLLFSSDIVSHCDSSWLFFVKVEDLAVLEEVIRMVLEIINSCLCHQLHHNPNLVYTLLYQKQLFQHFRTHPTFQDIIQNIETVSACRLCIVSNIMEVVVVVHGVV